MFHTESMKKYSLHQIQSLIMCTGIFMFFGAVAFYHFYIERPKHIETRIEIQQHELAIVSNYLDNVKTELKSFNRDYAVWSSTYNYIQNPEETLEYVEENILVNTYTHLRIDGIVYLDKSLNETLNQGVNYITSTPLDFYFTNFEDHPENISLLPEVINTKGESQSFNIISTVNGPAMVAISQIRKSDATGEFVGYLVFIRLIREELFKKITQETFVNVTMERQLSLTHEGHYTGWHKALEDKTLRAFNLIDLVDVDNKPVMLVNVQHKNSMLPHLFGRKAIGFFSVLIFLAILSSTYSYFRTIKPIKSLVRAIISMNESGELKPIKQDFNVRELDRISRHFNALVSTIQEKNKQLEKQVYIDSLTNIANRRHFEEHLDQQIDLCARNQIAFTVIMADLDYFKPYNDSLGHQAGDLALRKAAQTLSQPFQRKNDLCARYGGEEFIMLLSDISRENLTHKLQEIIKSFAELNLHHPSSSVAEYLTVSLGACMVEFNDFENYKISAKAIIRKADDALYEAKEGGRNSFRVTTFSPEE